MKSSFRERLSYRFENFMAKGGMSIFLSLVVLFLISLGVAVLLRWVVLLIFPGTDIFESILQHIWTVFLAMTDPGNMGVDTEASAWLKFTIVFAGVLGVVIFSMLIAFITTGLETTMWEFRKGRSRVVETGQTLILGWNERVVDIIRELVIANESEKRASIVILAEKEKVEMDDEVGTLIPDTQTTKVVTRSGVTSQLANLKKVNAAEAKSAIVLASCGQGATEEEKQISDAKVIKTILALIGCQGGKNELNIVAELFQDSNRDLVDTFESDLITTVDTWDILGKILVQTSRTSGLAVVYNEILSFDGGELYFHEADWGGIKFYDAIFHFPDGVPLGIRKAVGGLIMRPAKDEVLEEGDEILMLAEDDSTIRFNKSPVAAFRDLPYTHVGLDKHKERELILGWHSIAHIVVGEYADYLLEGSTVDIVVHHPSKAIIGEVQKLREENTTLQINLIDGQPMSFRDLQAIKPFGYDNVIILSQSEEDASAERTDSETLVILLLLRKILRDSAVRKINTKIITQVLNSENQELITQTNVDDFIISNKMITMIFAQLSEEPRIKELYDDIFQEEGSEIYLKPARLYFDSFPVKVTFADLIGQVLKRDEICLGVRKGALAYRPDKNFGVTLNIDKNKTIELDENDSVVVLAEDEL
jgi:ion channel POLLUX/CASTOR